MYYFTILLLSCLTGSKGFFQPSPLIISTPNLFSKTRELLKLSYSGNQNNDEFDRYYSPIDHNIQRTCLRHFLTQRSVQSFMFLLTQCRDPHTSDWLERFSESKNLLEYHGTASFNFTRFPHWDTFMLELMEMPREKIILQAKRRGRGHGGWSKNNPYMKDRFVEFEIDVDPTSLANRIISVREQIANELLQDIESLIVANEQILSMYSEKNMNERDNENSYSSRDASNNNGAALPFSDIDSVQGNSGESRNRWESHHSVGMTILNNNLAMQNAQSSSPLRKGTFDLLLLLSLQESMHRVLRTHKDSSGANHASFNWLREYYAENVEEYFDGNGAYGRADLFMEKLLSTPPSMKNISDTQMALIDPHSVAEEIIRTRGEVAHEWKDILSNVKNDHVDVRKVLFTQQMSQWGQTPSQDVTKESGAFE